MYKLINGWTKETVLAQIKKYNNGIRAMDNEENCRYLTSDGNRCAVGCFIPDGHPALLADEVINASKLLAVFPDLVGLMPFHVGNLNSFQDAHDQSDDKVYESMENFLNTKVE